ncbi:MAG: type VI secretion system tip protein VgrG [Deltaproteobacteria bacterium]|nr:type VI secretion system tip protein VgrG [Deltaproteobacteria bacterium]
MNNPSDVSLGQDYFFTWEGDGNPWRHLRVVSFHGHEAMSELYWFEIELHRDPETPDVNVEDLVGAAAALQIATGTTPAWRIIHGVITSAVELAEISQGARYRVVLNPPFVRQTVARQSWIHLERTLRTMISDTLKRPTGARMQEAQGGPPPPPTGPTDTYAPPKVTFEWRVVNDERLVDPEARPYCVQYCEPDFAFCGRLLEEDGIAYHFEHGNDECRLVLTDTDSGRMQVERPLGSSIIGREVPSWNAGGRLRPRSVFLTDYNWQRPQTPLGAASVSGSTDFVTSEYPGRYEHSRQTGEVLATLREQRFDAERQYSSAEGRCRALTAGSVFQLEHSRDKFDGRYLVTTIEHEGYERGFFADQEADFVPYRHRFECLRSGGSSQPSSFRPARVTPCPRSYGTQTAIVTAEPGSDAEINVGGPADIGCVRVQFQWDVLHHRRDEPTSCWIRVSQFFAGANHGALWHPRVGNEVIVEFLHGDPDRPIITGRVYNGTNLAPENATVRPTYSAIQSLTSPYDGNYNKLSFEDLQGEELVHIHAARDKTVDIEHNYTRNTKAHDAENAGSQSISVGSTQTIDVGTDQTINVGGKQSITCASQDIDVAGLQKMVVGDQSIKAAGTSGLLAGAMIVKKAPIVKIGGFTLIHEKAGAAMLLESGGFAILKAPDVTIHGTADVKVVSASSVEVFSATVDVHGSSTVKVHGPNVTVEGSEVNVKAGIVNIDGGAEVNVTGGTVNLNC